MGFIFLPFLKENHERAKSLEDLKVHEVKEKQERSSHFQEEQRLLLAPNVHLAKSGRYHLSRKILFYSIK